MKSSGNIILILPMTETTKEENIIPEKNDHRIKSLKKARDAKKIKKEIEDMRVQHYTEALKGVNLSIAQLSSQMNSVIAIINASGVQQKRLREEIELEEQPKKKLNTGEMKRQKEEEIEDIIPKKEIESDNLKKEVEVDYSKSGAKYSYYLGEATGMIGLLSLYLVNRYITNTNKENPAHSKYDGL